MSITAIYAGTFDPITNGHTDIALRATRLFDRVIVAISASGHKAPTFTLAERVDMAAVALGGQPAIEILSFDVLVTDLARREGATVLIRGLRAVSDFDYEFQMAGMNRKLFAEAETVFLTPAEQYSCVSSSLVRDIVRLGGDVSDFVHPVVNETLKARILRSDDPA